MVLALGLSATLLWSVLARIPVYAVCRHVPLDVTPAFFPVTAPVTGQVRLASMQQGHEVQAGDLLVELDTTEPQLQVAEERQRLVVLEAHRAARRQEHTAADAAWQATGQGTQAVLDEARTRHQEVVSALQTAQDKAQRFGPLALLAEQPQLKTAVDTTRLALQRLEHEQRVRALEWQAREAQHQREVVVLDGKHALVTARLQRLDHVLAMRRIRAALTGRLSAVLPLVPGVVVREGDRLGLLTPPGALQVTATVPATAARGPLHAGQAVRLQLTTGPTSSEWLDATIAQEPEIVPGADLSVVLRLAPAARLPFPSQPTWSSTIAIEVARVAPLTWCLRALGRYLGLWASTTT